MSDLVLTEEQQLLQSTTADFVRQSLPVSRLRALRDAGDATGFSPELWQAMGALGWPGILLPEAYGGLGLGYAEAVVVLEELGKVLAPEPFLSTVLLAGNAILLGGSERQKQDLLPRVAQRRRGARAGASRAARAPSPAPRRDPRGRRRGRPLSLDGGQGRRARRRRGGAARGLGAQRRQRRRS